MFISKQNGGARARRQLAISATFALTAGALVLPVSPAFAVDAIDGAQTSGDSVFPNVGNGGYDALDYSVAIKWSPDAVQSGSLVSGSFESATTTMKANAPQPLRSFSLDFEGLEIDSVKVNGVDAAFERVIDADAIKYKLVITPATPVSGEFTTTIAYHGAPVTHIDTDGSAEGWARTTDGAILLGQPVGMMAGYPHNNTPGDKATYTFSIDIPSELSAADGSGTAPAAAVSNGELQSKTVAGDRTTWVWRQDKQMASELSVVGIGRYDVIEGEVTLSDGRKIPSWSFVDWALSPANKDIVNARLAELQTITQNLEKVYGPYPGNSTGVIVDTVPSAVNYALETQDRSFFPSVNSVKGNTLIHELVHQWYGNNVAPSTWTDIWIGEGMASWGPSHYNSAAGFGSGTATEQTYFNSWNSKAANHSDWTIAPGAQTDSAELYGYQTYTRGAQFWEALKISIGDEAFLKLVPEYQARYGGKSVANAQLKALAEELSGRDLTAFWQDWIMDADKPAWPEKLTAKLTTPEQTAPLERGDGVEYTLTATNTGKIPLASSVVTVDATALLESATLEDPLPAGLALDGTTLTWTVPATATGAESSVKFSATVRDTTSGGTLDATARVATLGGTCSECSTSLDVAEYELAPAPKPTISGEAREGLTLSAKTDGWPADTAFTYQWSVGGDAVDGATASTFVVPASAIGQTVTVAVTGTKDRYLPTVVSSDPTAKVLKMPFRDVTPTTKFAREIWWMADQGYSTGTKKTDAEGKTYFVYEPQVAVTREAMAAFLFRVTDPADYEAPKQSPFADVRTTDKFYKQIAWMYDTELSTGTKQATGKPKYEPKSTITREAMAAFLFRLDAPKTYLPPKTSPFADVQPGDKFYKQIAWMHKAGISTGTAQPTGKPKFGPKSSVKRDAMAAFLYRSQQ